MIESLVINKKYRLIHISEGEQEVWLENISSKKYPFIRLRRIDLDWSSFLKRDIESVLYRGNQVRQAVLKRDFSILNIYVSEQLPVDDYEHIFEASKAPSGNKVHVQSMIVSVVNLHQSLQQLTDILGNEILLSLKREYDLNEIEKIKRRVINISIEEEKKEKNLLSFGKPLFTYLFIGLQVLMFIILELAGGSENPYVLIEYGAKFNLFILAGEWWRFITPIFLHIGFLHLFMNSLALYYLGSTVEKIYGSSRFLLIYLFSGFLGVVGSFIFNPSISAGASGAIFGCFGALLYFGLVHPRIFLRTLGSNIIILLGINLVLGFIVPSIDNAGHIGGLIGGFLAAGVVHFPKNKKLTQQALFLIGTFFLTSVALYFGYHFPNLP